MIVEPAMRRLLLTNEARRWVGIQEVGGNNRGQIVEMFLRTSGLPPGSPWCLAFAQDCISRADQIATLFGDTDGHRKVPTGAHCLTFWNESSPEFRTPLPRPGSIVIWRHKGGAAGHAGVVVEALGSAFRSVEGNTSPGVGVNRDGDGVFLKSHSLEPSGQLELMGFVHPWGLT
jgi:hypothetical protein